MSRYYNIPNKVNLPIKPHIIESEIKSSYQIKHRQPTISISKENTPPRCTQQKLHKPWQTVVKTTISKPGSNRISYYFLLLIVYIVICCFRSSTYV